MGLPVVLTFRGTHVQTDGRARVPAAAVLREISQKWIHDGILGRIKNVAAFLARRHQTCVQQFFKVKCQRRGRRIKQFCQSPRVQPGRAGLDEMAIRLKPCFMSKGGE